MHMLLRVGTRRSGLAGRFFRFAVIAGLVLAAEQLYLAVAQPTQSADLAVNQLQASDEAAEALRLHETVKSNLPAIRFGLIGLAGLAIFTGVLRSPSSEHRACSTQPAIKRSDWFS